MRSATNLILILSLLGSLVSLPQTSAAKTVDLKDECVKLFDKYALPLQELWSKRGKNLRGENTDGAALIEDFTASHCQEANTRVAITTLISKILNEHTGKIGVILPISSNSYLLHVIHAFEANLVSKNLDPKKILVVLDNQGRDDLTLQGIASLIFEHKVSAIIGGQKAGDSAMLRLWGSRLLIPTFLLTEPPAGLPAQNIYYARPSQATLSKAAVAANIRFGHRRVSILIPQDQHSGAFITAYEVAATSAGISIVNRVPYDSKRFDLMEASAKKIFRLDSNDRQDELKDLFKAAREQAKQSGEKFNPNMVALQPDIRQDAVMIPDNFKVVRHFAKIFGYLGVRKMPLFGQFEWRSEGLISPWDSFLGGSYFVDFFGAYTSLPAPIRVPTTADSPFFVAPDKIEQADFSLLAWRAIEWPLRLSLKTSEMRRKLYRLIPKIKDDRTEGNYDEQNTIIWPPSIFTVNGNGSKKGDLNLIGQ
jgi:Receptor family ligand binding region